MASQDIPVTVIVATRDRPASLRRTLQHLSALEEHPPLIVVDNSGSMPLPDTGGRVRSVHLPANFGASARNVGARLAATQYVAFCDDDSWWEPGALARAVGVLEANPGLAAVAGSVLVGSSGHLDPTSLAMGSGDFDLHGRRATGGRRGVTGFLACAVVLRRGAFLAAGGFEARYLIGSEEEELALKLAAAGWELAYAPEAVARHYPAEDGSRHGRTRLQARNALLNAWRYLPAPLAASRSAQVMGALGPFSALSSLCGAVAHLAWVSRSRRPVSAALARRHRLDHAAAAAAPAAAG